MNLPEAGRAIPAEPLPWPLAPMDLFLPENVVHVWRADLLAPATDVLSADERERAAQFHFDKDRNRYMAGRAILRELIGRYERVSPGGIQFNYNSYGKPGLQNSSLCFNVSHSGDLALLAFSRNRSLGIDLECIRPGLASKEIASQFFSADEIEVLRAQAADSLPRAFFTCWTRKEAFIKAHGSGLSLPLHQFAVSIDSPARLLRTDFDPEAVARWTLRDLSVAEGFAAALAVEGDPEAIECWRWA